MSYVTKIDHNNAVLDVEFSYSPYRCNRVGHIDNWLPDDEEELELIAITYKGVDVWPLLSDDDLDAIEGEIYEDISKNDSEFD